MTNARIKNAVKTLKGFTKEARYYWLDVMVKAGDLSKAEAGYIIFYKLI